LRVLPFGRFLALYYLKQVQVFLFQFFFLQKHLVEAEKAKKPHTLLSFLKKEKSNQSVNYLACLMASIHALQSDSASAMSS
jgi:hypothetical protein